MTKDTKGHLRALLIFAILQNVARLAVQGLADSLQSGESHGLGLACLQNREVRLCDAYLLSQSCEDIFRLAIITSTFTIILIRLSLV